MGEELAKVRLAFANLGTVQIELIQPVEGKDISLFQ